MDLEFVKTMLSDPEINISEVSRITGISKVSLYNIKNGKQIPTEKNYAKLCKYYSDAHTGETHPEIERLAKDLQEELIRTGKETTIVISPRTIGQLENFKIY